MARIRRILPEYKSALVNDGASLFTSAIPRTMEGIDPEKVAAEDAKNIIDSVAPRVLLYPGKCIQPLNLIESSSGRFRYDKRKNAAIVWRVRLILAHDRTFFAAWRRVHVLAKQDQSRTVFT